jgi:hypothetical protein
MNSVACCTPVAAGVNVTLIVQLIATSSTGGIGSAA